MSRNLFTLFSSSVVMFTGCAQWFGSHLPIGEQESGSGDTSDSMQLSSTLAEESTVTTTQSTTPTSSSEASGMAEGSSTGSAGTIDLTTGGGYLCEDGELLMDDGGCHKQNSVKFAFVTEGTFQGDVGKEYADSLCQAAADENPERLPSGAYLAWLSAKSNSPVHDFSHFDGPYVKRNANRADVPFDIIKIADRWSGLVSGSLLSAIDVTERGQVVEAPRRVWTGTDDSGKAGPKDNVTYVNCSNWSSDNHWDAPSCEEFIDLLYADYGAWGDVDKLNGGWSLRPIAPCVENNSCCSDFDLNDLDGYECDNRYHIYCFQQ